MMSQITLYDLVIVGRGMIGSAAARHAAKMTKVTPQTKIALVGPSEVAEDKKEEGVVFGAHYDEGRITRRTDNQPEWAELASRSIARYEEIKTDAAIKSASTDKESYDFYVECGHLAVSNANGEMIETRIENAKKLGVAHSRLKSTSEILDQFPFLNFPQGFEGIMEPGDSGYISARGLVAAQTKAAENFGVEIIDTIVEKVEQEEKLESEEKEGVSFLIHCSDAVVLRSKKVLIACGAFTNLRPLLPVTLDVLLTRTQTVHFHLNETDAERLVDMPSVIFKSTDKWAYFLPPIRYPDGTLRIKLGGSSLMREADSVRHLSSANEVIAWHRSSGVEIDIADMTRMLHEFVPNLNPVHTHGQTCCNIVTPGFQANVGEVSQGWAVATDGNGCAAKSSDEIGRLAALCLLRPNDFEREKICGRPVSEVFKPRIIT